MLLHIRFIVYNYTIPLILLHSSSSPLPKTPTGHIVTPQTIFVNSSTLKLLYVNYCMRDNCCICDCCCMNVNCCMCDNCCMHNDCCMRDCYCMRDCCCIRDNCCMRDCYCMSDYCRVICCCSHVCYLPHMSCILQLVLSGVAIWQMAWYCNSVAS